MVSTSVINLTQPAHSNNIGADHTLTYTNTHTDTYTSVTTNTSENNTITIQQFQGVLRKLLHTFPPQQPQIRTVESLIYRIASNNSAVQLQLVQHLTTFLQSNANTLNTAAATELYNQLSIQLHIAQLSHNTVLTGAVADALAVLKKQYSMAEHI